MEGASEFGNPPPPDLGESLSNEIRQAHEDIVRLFAKHPDEPEAESLQALLTDLKGRFASLENQMRHESDQRRLSDTEQEKSERRWRWIDVAIGVSTFVLGILLAHVFGW